MISLRSILFVSHISSLRKLLTTDRLKKIIHLSIFCMQLTAQHQLYIGKTLNVIYKVQAFNFKSPEETMSKSDSITICSFPYYLTVDTDPISHSTKEGPWPSAKSSLSLTNRYHIYIGTRKRRKMLGSQLSEHTHAD